MKKRQIILSVAALAMLTSCGSGGSHSTYLSYSTPGGGTSTATSSSKETWHQVDYGSDLVFNAKAYITNNVGPLGGPDFHYTEEGYRFVYNRSHKSLTDEDKERYGSYTPELFHITCPTVATEYGYSVTFRFTMRDGMGSRWGETTALADIKVGDESLGDMEFANFLSNNGEIESVEQKFTAAKIGGLFAEYNSHGTHALPFQSMNVCFQRLFVEMNQLNEFFLARVGTDILTGSSIPDYNDRYFNGTRITTKQSWNQKEGFVYDANKFASESTSFSSTYSSVPATYQGYKVSSSFHYGIWSLTLEGEKTTSGSKVVRKYGKMQLVYGTMETVSFIGGTQELYGSSWDQAKLAAFSYMEVDRNFSIVKNTPYSYNKYGADVKTALQVASIALNVVKAFMQSHGYTACMGTKRTDGGPITPATLVKSEDVYAWFAPLASPGVTGWDYYEYGFYDRDGYSFNITMGRNPSRDMYQIQCTSNVMFDDKYLITSFFNFYLDPDFRFNVAGSITDITTFGQTSFFIDGVNKSSYPNIDVNSGYLGEIVNDSIGMAGSASNYVNALVNCAQASIYWFWEQFKTYMPNHKLW